MPAGGNKGSNKGQVKKGGKKKAHDPFTRKEWYDIRAPVMFSKRTCARTLVTRTQGTKIASDGLKKRVVFLSLADLIDKNDEAFRKFKLQIEDVQGKYCLTNFHGMDLTRDKLCSVVKKWQSTIEVHADARTTDGYLLRFFIIAFTKKIHEKSTPRTYAQSSRIKRIRARMVEVVQREVVTCDLKEVVEKLIPDSIGRDCRKTGSFLYPLSDALVRKVKVLRKPKLDIGKLMEFHNEGKDGTTGDGITRPDHYEPPVVDSV